MALGSPGVQVTVIDESFYTPAAPGTVPIIFVATAQDKSNASGTGTAQGTTAANAGKVWTITSQRDLTDTFGTPLFYTDASGNPIHGGELNEYGLQAAYSLLGVSSRAYISRADIDLAQLAPRSDAPTGSPVSGTYWVDTKNSLFGINEWNSTTSKFTTKTPLIIDSSNLDQANLSGTVYVPLSTFGKLGDYAVVVTPNNSNGIWYKNASDSWTQVLDGFDSKSVKISAHTDYPQWTASTPSGSVWIKTTTPGLGANWIVKYYNGSTKSWNQLPAPIYPSTQYALQALDYTGGGKNIPVNTVFIESNYDHTVTAQATFKLWRRKKTGPTVVIGAPGNVTMLTSGGTFSIRETLANSSTWDVTRYIELPGVADAAGQVVADGINTSGLVNISAIYNAETNAITISHKLGGDFELADDVNTPLSSVGLSDVVENLYIAPPGDTDGATAFTLLASNWQPLEYEAQSAVPTTVPANGQLWYNSEFTQVDILVNTGSAWHGYRSEYVNTDPAGPTVSALAPDTQSDGTALVTGDIWISTADMEQYGHNIYVRDAAAKKWILQDTTDQTSPSGWVFADARWGTTGASTTPASIKQLLTSNYVDPDAPDPALYPKGMKLWNLRRSGFNVKKYVLGHLNLESNAGLNPRFKINNGLGSTNDPMISASTGLPIYSADRWVTVSSNNENGSGKFGRQAQRGYVVKELKSMIDTNYEIRDTDTLVFNLIATPGYPELIQNMVGFNIDRGQTAFVVGDTPFRLKATGTALSAWGNNKAMAYDNGDDGAVTHDEYLGLFYPSGYTTDNTGNYIVVPPSHMMLRTIANSDAKSYQWFAPAGTRRGGVDNVTSVGYIDSVTKEFTPTALPESIRNIMQDATTQIAINPIATLPGVGIVNFGQQTRAKNASSLDRINVARLVCFLRRQLTVLARPYLFEPNDNQTRREIKFAAESLLLELVSQRAITDFIVVCDKSNNTNARIDRSELYMDIAVEPMKAVEFIYIPLRLKNTGEIAAGQ